jgi:O-antigen biosynthesis protein
LPPVVFSSARDVEERDGRPFASTDSPWLKCEIDPARLAGRWVRLTYASGFLDPLVRPVLRIVVGDERRDEILPAALHGRGRWLGPIPNGATEIWISPTNRRGPFSFRIETWNVVPRVRLLAELFAADPWRGAKWLWAGVLGHREFARLQVRRALCPTPLRRYDSWRRARWRRFDREDFDRPASGAAGAPHFRFVARGDRASAGAIEGLVRRLDAQPYPNWSLLLRGADDRPAALEREPRILFLPLAAPVGRWIEGLAEDDFLAPIAVDDGLPEYALDALAAERRRHPDVDLFYADEEGVDRHGRYLSPRLKPDWSPVFQAASPYLGAPVAIRSGFASKLRDAEPSEFAAALDPSAKVFHVRRVLLTRPGANAAPRTTFAPLGDSPAPPSADSALRASIVIPTRDRFELLRGCIASIRDRTSSVDFELVVADNGGVEPRASAYLRELARDPRCRVISRPGPFNYARLCNQAALEAKAPFLVFLNNDVEILSAEWLSRLLSLAARADVGAVSGKLLYRDGRVQHAGIVLGIDGRAGHFERRASANDPGYFGSLEAPHEVSAVTGACLAVAANKFAAIGGFDEIHLPVEFNDVDLCLRLNQRGWKTLLEPRARLIHLESASRGANVLLDERYRDQLAYFTSRWADALRDDPYFHPALSLDALGPALG